MRAPFRKHVKPIGAKWLRNGVNNGGQNAEFQFQSSSGSNSHDPHVTPQNQETIRKGEILGDNNFQKNQMHGNVGIRNVFNTCAVISTTNQRKEPIIIEK